MVAGVREGCPGSGGGRLDALPGSCASTSTYGWPWLGSAGLGGAGWPLLGERWASGRCGGVLEACRRRGGARAGRRVG